MSESTGVASRRAALRAVSSGFGLMAFAGLADWEARRARGGESPASSDPLAPKPPHFAPRAKRVIFLCMRGGPSHMETFDPKPQLNVDSGKPGRSGPQSKLLGSRWKFQPHGESGLEVVELLPETAKHADRLCVLRGMHTDNENHPQALEQLHTGSFQFVRPSLGAWTLYGLGTENRDLPGFISINPLTALGGLRYYHNAFLPAACSATLLGDAGRPSPNPTIGDLKNLRLSRAAQRQQLDLLQAMNRESVGPISGAASGVGATNGAGAASGASAGDAGTGTSGDARVDGLIASFELAFRMQDALPQVMDLSGETKETLEAYRVQESFGRQCLLARRFAEAGVRFIEVTHTDWDHHGFLSTAIPKNCQAIDRPIAALLGDLARRGLLDDTLVVWGGEFGRTPDDPTTDGRGHNNKGFSMWMCGAGVRGGMAYGATDEHGYEAVEGKMHIHDLHATLLHLIGLDHEKLTYRHGGRDYRLTDVKGRVVRDILS
ncbi:MAG: hypothetical protein RLY70_860 [Planctomycetota bacterium]|jgi:hypothetical protein